MNVDTGITNSDSKVDSLFLKYGLITSLLTIQELEYLEEYESCSAIYDSVKKYSKLLNEDMPTQYSEKVVLDILEKSKSKTERSIILKGNYKNYVGDMLNEILSL